MKTFALTLLGIGVLATSLSVQATSISYDFNLPATSSYSPPYPNVATLTITDYNNGGSDYGLNFSLDPNEASPGVKDPASLSYIDSLDLAYSGAALASDAFTDTNAANTKIVSFNAYAPPPPSNSNIDSSYKVTNLAGNQPGGYLAFNWSQVDPTSFNFTEVSTWAIAGLTLDDITGWIAYTNSNKPTPIEGIISTSSYSLPNDFQSTPSNWVAPAVVPIPATAFLFAPALLGLFGLRRKSGQAKSNADLIGVS